jgi:S-adenosylmethionine synthetase
MIEKVNPQHPDKVADRIAGALVDYAYTKQDRPSVAVEVLVGHGKVTIIAETSVLIPDDVVEAIVKRIAGDQKVEYIEVPQDPELARNQGGKTRAGDNGIFKGVPLDSEVSTLSDIARSIYAKYPTDGKYIYDEADNRLILCQSNATNAELEHHVGKGYKLTINPLGEWTGGTDVDTGATNRKLGSDMGRAVTGGGLHGKDLSKADVSVNIYAHLKAQETGEEVNICCAIGDETVDGKDYADIVAIAGEYIKELGGFEKLAEWGLV